MLASEPPRHLQPQATVDLLVTAGGRATLLTMTENPHPGLGRAVHDPLTDLLIARRIAAALGLLAAAVEQHRP